MIDQSVPLDVAIGKKYMLVKVRVYIQKLDQSWHAMSGW